METRRSLPSYIGDSDSRISVDSHYSANDEQRQKPVSTRLFTLAMKNKVLIISSSLFLFIISCLILSISLTSSGPRIRRNGVSSSTLEADFLALKIRLPAPAHLDYDPSSFLWDNGRNYGIVIDAGSSGSRIYIYSWLDPALSSHSSSLESAIKLEKADASGSNFELKEEPGISTFSINPKNVGPHLEPLLKFASNTIPLSKQSKTPIFLFATAGMRLVDPGPRSEILQEACRFVKSQYLYYINDCDSHFRVISGELEGYFIIFMNSYSNHL